MNSSIQASIDELEAINTELGLMRKKMYALKDRKALLEENVIQFLHEREQPGIKYRGKAIIIKDETRRKRKKKAEKNEDLTSVLRSYGIHDTENALKDILEAQRGTAHPETCIKIIKDR